MQTKSWAAALFLLAASVGAAQAQQSSETDAINVANQAFYTAFSAKDMEAMGAVWAKKPYVMYYDPRSKAISVGYDDVMGTWSDLFDRLSKVKITIASVKVQTDEKLAWVTGVETAEIERTGGSPQTVNTVVSNVFEKIRGRWQMISHQAQMAPD